MSELNRKKYIKNFRNKGSSLIINENLNINVFDINKLVGQSTFSNSGEDDLVETF